jgi:hypothetical protein
MVPILPKMPLLAGHCAVLTRKTDNNFNPTSMA